MILCYGNSTEENFFEKGRFDDNNRPKYKEISFLDNSTCKDLGVNFDKNSEEIISTSEWKKLKKIFYFNEKDYKIDHLRKHAFSKQPLFYKYINDNQIIPVENLPYKDYPSLLEATKDVNIPTYSSLYEHFARNEHIGTCGYTALMFSSMFNDFKFFSRGNAKFLAGTKNSIDGNHAWLETNINGKDLLIDTSLLLAIPTELKEKLGYSSRREPYIREELLDIHYHFDTFYEICEVSSKYQTKNKLSYNQYQSYLRQIDIDYR